MTQPDFMILWFQYFLGQNILPKKIVPFFDSILYLKSYWVQKGKNLLTKKAYADHFLFNFALKSRKILSSLFYSIIISITFVLKIYVMTQRLNSLYDSRISEIKSNHQMVIEHEAIMLSKFRRNRKIKRERGSKPSSAINHAELYSDQLSSPNQPGISTRSSKKPKTSEIIIQKLLIQSIAII